MKDLTIYALQTLTCSGVLLALYILLLERRVHFGWSRAYLLASTATAAVIPLLRIPVWPAEEPLAAQVTAGEWSAEILPDTALAITPQLLCILIYATGAALLLGLMLWQGIHILRLRREAQIRHTDRFTLVSTPRPIAAFSFFRSIYLWEQTPADALTAIVAHEASHIAHRHSVERIAMEAMKALLWWNPFVWISARRLTEAEEFEADDDVLRGGYDLKTYMDILFTQLFGYSPEIANSLRNSLTKKRFQMMTRPKMSSHGLLRMAGTLPALLALLCAFAFTTRAAEPTTELPQPLILINGVSAPANSMQTLDPSCIESISVLKDRTAIELYGEGAANGVILITTKPGGAIYLSPDQIKNTNTPAVRLRTPADGEIRVSGTGGKDDSEQPFLVAEKMPQFQDGDLNTFRTWVNGEVGYPAQALQKEIEGRVLVSFVVERDGSVGDVQILQSPSELLSAEVLRVFRGVDKGSWTPGMQRGEIVRVKYVLPIEFRLPAKPAQSKQ